MRALVIKEDFFVFKFEKVHFIDLTTRALSLEWTFCLSTSTSNWWNYSTSNWWLYSSIFIVVKNDWKLHINYSKLILFFLKFAPLALHLQEVSLFLKCTRWHHITFENQKFSGGDTPGPPSMAQASGPRVQALPEKSPHLSNQQPQLQFASYGTVRPSYQIKPREI